MTDKLREDVSKAVREWDPELTPEKHERLVQATLEVMSEKHWASARITPDRAVKIASVRLSGTA